MTKRITTFLLAIFVFTCFASQNGYAIGAKQAAASLLLPTTGQSMNGELTSTKSKLMAGLEVGLVTGTAILGGVVGGPVVWATVGPLIANHVWSSVDAYQSAQKQVNPAIQQQLQQAQQRIDQSRQNRYAQEQSFRSDLRERVRLAGEMRIQ